MIGRVAPLLALLLCAACSATSSSAQRYEDGAPRGFAVLGRYAAFEDYEVDASAGGTAIGSDEIDLDGYGAEAIFLGSGPGFMLGWDEREYEDVDSTEFYAGVRFMLAPTDVRPYLAAKVRYGLGLEFPSTALSPDFESDEFWGYGAGGGLMAFATDNLFFDLNLSYEDVFEDIDAEGVDVDLDGWVGTVGVGFAF
jgi:opacity protein-like surface antigen